MRVAAALLLLVAGRTDAAAAGLLVEVRDARGAAVPDAVVYAIPEAKHPPLAVRQAVLDQKNRMFVPHLLPIQTGTAVTFPNSDNVRHQVYSFSSAKKFQLPLYAGTPAAPVVFDKPGVVTLGCNIHDQMSAYLVVVDTPYFAATAEGRAELLGLPEGKYDVRVWYAGMRNEPASQTVILGANEPKSLAFQIGNK
ncbi:MAG: methylamine utilization protein [Vicinamibacteria bacterium]